MSFSTLYANIIHSLKNGNDFNFFPYIDNCIHINQKNIDLIKKTHFVAHKADGERCLYLVNKGNIYSITMKKRLFIGNIECPDMLVDGEFMGEYLAFDLLFLHEASLPKLLTERLKMLQELINKHKLPISIRSIYSISKFDINMKPSYKSDGIIFIPQEGGESLKWKPRELLTIDFYLKDTGVGNRCLLCINGKRGLIPFQYKDKFYHTKDDRLKPGMIVECVFKDETFYPLRIRKDKLKSNGMRTVRNLIEVMENFINLETIIKYVRR